MAVSIASVVPAFAQEDSTDKSPVALAAGKKQTLKTGIAAHAWYWRDQRQQKITNPVDGTDVATLELKNPYCPDTAPVGSPPDQACKSGRLPIEVRAGDYARPHKLSAVNFDLSLVPVDSKITKFEVKFYEATDEQSRSTQYNVGGHRIQACEITGVFGEGEARLYNERPRFECTSKDASALRDVEKTGKGDNQQQRNVWTFDLTAQAKEWMKKGEFFTSIMLHPQEPRDPTPEDQAWQVVFAGPFEEKFGIDSKITFVSSTVVPPPPPPPPTTDPTVPPSDPTDPGSDPAATTDPPPSSGVGSSTTTTTGTGTPSDTGTTAGDEAGPSGEEEAADPALAAPAAPTSGSQNSVPAGLPLYVWLAILAGMMGFSMVRSIVLEKTTGIRPNGVLAQIQKLNAQRRGTAPTPAGGSSSPFGAAAAALGGLGSKITGGAGKIAQLFSKKKG